MKMDPEERYPNISAILAEFQKKKAAVWGGTMLFGVLLIFLAIRVYFFFQQKEMEVKRGDLLSVPGEHMLFDGQDDALYLMLTEGTEKRAQLSLSEKEAPIEVAAKLTAEGLSLAIIDTSGRTDYMLSNQYEIPGDYAGTSLYAEVLFFDTDNDGRDEIWAAVSDRALLELSGGRTLVNQNYMAGWCVFRDEDGNYCLADGQLFTEGTFEIGTVIPDGIWLEKELAGYRLEDGSLVYIFW